ncbi:M-phase phosphoprotein 6 [Macadamia integrifolia]|uniref:M-phase phosphoprotein 6 n=1 Tax=Macadamia integrifolia TaxID=60698 RepID=UPI001C52BBE5|nr:M-phase phosphoprotein 6 [Macadamia integrifolia]
MAKRELSSTLKNLKFMQRAVQKEEKQKKEEDEVKPVGNFVSANTHRKCIVIMEGSPHPGALKGRMSFQSFNPSIDKLNEEIATPGQSEASSTSAGNQISYDRENESSQIRSEDSYVARSDSNSDVDHKRKQPDANKGTHPPNKSQRNASEGGDQCSSAGSSKGSSKQHKRDKLDWNVLRPPKSDNKRV